MPEAKPCDKRGFFVLPQGYEGGGYYCYGTPDGGRSQYAHPKLISFMSDVAIRWCAQDVRKFGVGNISLPDGRKGDHATHIKGLDVDIRPIRKDGRRLACTIRDRQYDHDATARLVEILYGTGMVRTILFNDGSIRHVRRWPGHDNHLHVSLKA
ncbi:penicillin-insensitive murein endopeptidase [Massilia cavernae]|uniref:Extensin-like C-terminal domain-containing protein n=1 Tax=Massilia cavernae TaxID=2320864 RepID=A0A418XAP4_9BURK|nr:penicillin-insensitive murein endopeptidase [Massilia cavernae]RJG09550.1 hypothetical protein D3872_22185 [Massilia cavernae]